MDGFERMHEDFELSIKSDEESCSSSPDTNSDKPLTIRDKLDAIIHSHRFMVSVMVLVVLDCLMVVAILLFDLEIVKIGDEHHYIPEIFHYLSLSILSLFMIEIAVRLYVMRLEFFKHKLEVFDAFIVIVSFVLDIVFINHTDAFTGMGLLVVLRLWRITRIVNGIVMSVERQAEAHLEKEHNIRLLCQKEIFKYHQCCLQQDIRIETLEKLLTEKGIDFPLKHICKPKSFGKITGEEQITEKNYEVLEIGL